MYRTLLGILAAMLVALALVGLTFQASVEEPAQFRFGNSTEPKTLDSGLATGEPEHVLISALFEGLTRQEPKSLLPVPGVAERWDVSDDELTYTFHLRSDARWSDGRPVTAHDFVFSWQRILEPAFGAQYAYLLHMIRHAEAYNVGAAYLGSLREKLKPPVEAWIAAGQEVPAPKLRELFAASEAAVALQQSPSAELSALLGRRTGTFSVADLTQLRSLVDIELQALESRVNAARSHFGKDEGAFALDDRTLVVQLRSPTPYFLDLAAFYPLYPVPRWVVEQPGRALDWFLPATIVNNGAYNLGAWSVNHRIRLNRSTTYWNRAQVRTERMDALPIENGTTGLNLYLTGAIDWLPEMYPRELVHDLRERPDFYANAGMVVYFFRLNCTRGPLQDKRVRQAINLAIDRQSIVDNVLGLGQIPAYGMVPPGMPGYESAASSISYNPARARELLAAAGYPEGKGFPQLGILYNTMATHKQIAEVVADQLRRNLGIPITAYNQEWQSYIATTTSLDFDIARAGWVGDYRDPNTFLDNFVTNGGNNNTGFSSPAYDTLIRAAGNVGEVAANPARVLAVVKDRAKVEGLLQERASAAPEARGAIQRALRLHLLAEAEAILVQDEFPLVPVHFYVHSGLLSPKVQGFYSTLEFPDGSRGANLQDVHPLDAISVTP
jgi:oligopeptide transport system substrate-binding protein